MLGENQKILIIDDDGLDFKSFQKAFERAGFKNEVIRFDNGVSAMEFLTEMAEVSPDEIPRVVFLDLNMPRVSGFEFLEFVRSRMQLKPMTVFVLTTSSNPVDIRKAYNYNIAGYFVKPMDMEDFRKLVVVLKNYLDVCEFF